MSRTLNRWTCRMMIGADVDEVLALDEILWPVKWSRGRLIEECRTRYSYMVAYERLGIVGGYSLMRLQPGKTLTVIRHGFNPADPSWHEAFLMMVHRLETKAKNYSVTPRIYVAETDARVLRWLKSFGYVAEMVMKKHLGEVDAISMVRALDNR